MGTRNLTIVISNNETKVAQYGQWDGYYEGVGATVFQTLKTILKAERLKEFKEKVNGCTFVDRNRIKKYYEELGVDIDKEAFVSLEIANEYKKRHPQLDRDMGGEILNYILTNGPQELNNQEDFAKDSLFCEYAYVIDLDNEYLEIYEGYNRKILTEKDRFFYLQDENEEYKPIKMVSKLPFSIIKEIKKEAFIGWATINGMLKE